MAKRRTIGKNPLDALDSETLRAANGSAVEVEGDLDKTVEEVARVVDTAPETEKAAEEVAAIEPAPEPARAPEQPPQTDKGLVKEKLTEPAKTGDTLEDSSEQIECLTFHLAGEEYALEVDHVREIVEYDILTRVPNTSAEILGVFNLRGLVVPVIDLAVKLGLPETRFSKRSCIIIVEVVLEEEKTVMGVVADAVSEVIKLKRQDIETAPTFGANYRVDYLQGLGKAGKKFVMILDINRVLSFDKSTASVEFSPLSREAIA